MTSDSPPEQSIPDTAEAWLALGCHELSQARWGAARDAFTQAAETARRDSDPAREAAAFANGASAMRLAGDPEAAVAGYLEAWEIRERADIPVEPPLRLNLAMARADCGSRKFETGDTAGARAAWEEAAQDIVAWAPALQAGALLLNLAGVHYQLGDPAAALERLERAETLLVGLDLPATLEAQQHANRGLVLLALNNSDAAEVDLERAATLFEALGMPERAARQLAALSDLHRYRAELTRAIDLHLRVMAMEKTHGFRVTEPGGLLYTRVHDRSQPLPPPNEAGQVDPTPRPPKVWTRASKGDERPFLIVSPPAHGSHGPVFPRGATTIASFLRAQGVPAQVLPMGHWVDDFAGRSQARDAARRALEHALEVLRPRALGLSIQFSYLYPRALELAAMAKRLRPDMPIVVGGAHVTFQDRECLRDSPEVDVVVRGEGEWTVLALLDRWEQGRDLGDLRGVTWRDEAGNVHRNPGRPLGDVANLAAVDFGLLPDTFCRRMEVAAITSRGCAFRCRFCHERTFWGGHVRAHSPERIVAEGDRLAAVYDNPFRGVDDSMLDMRTPYFGRLVELLGRRDWLRPGFGFLTRLDTVSPEGLEAMTRNRIHVISVGAESGAQPVLDVMGKGLRLETAERAMVMARDAGVGVNGFFIVGHPGDSPEHAARSHGWIDKLFRQRMVQWIDLSIFTPYPGTPFFEQPERWGVEILSHDWSLWRRSNRPIAQLEGYGAGEIYLDYLRLLMLQHEHLKGSQGALASDRR